MGLFRALSDGFFLLRFGNADKGDPGDVATRVGENGVEFLPPSGGGNPFDQDLNIDDDVEFASVESVGDIGGVVQGFPYFAWNAAAHAFMTTVSPPDLSYPADPSNYYAPSLADAGAGNLSNGVYSYKFTFVTPSGETLPSQATAEVTVVDASANGKVSVPWPSSFDQLYPSATRIYRTEANGSVYKFHSERDYLSGIGPFTDNTADAALGAVAPTVSTAIEPGLSFSGDGAIKAIYSENYQQDMIQLATTGLSASRQIIISPETQQLQGTTLTIYGGGAVNGNGGGLQLHGGDAVGFDLAGFGSTSGGDVFVAGGLGNGSDPSNGGSVRLIPGSKNGASGNNGEVFILDADNNTRIKVEKDGDVVVDSPNWSVSAAGVFACKNPVTAGAGVASTHRVAVVVSGVTYYFLATTVA